MSSIWSAQTSPNSIRRLIPLASIFLPISTVNLQQGYEHKRFAPPALKNLYVPIAFIEEVATQTPSAKTFVETFVRCFPTRPTSTSLPAAPMSPFNLMAEAWKRAGTTDTDDVISALESGINFDAPEGRVLLDPATHHLTMTIRLAQVQADHSSRFVYDFGPIEPWWLRSLGVNLVRHDDAKQYLPASDQALRQVPK